MRERLARLEALEARLGRPATDDEVETLLREVGRARRPVLLMFASIGAAIAAKREGAVPGKPLAGLRIGLPKVIQPRAAYLQSMADGTY